jgi:2-dehydropantoate 2-reductase
MGPYRSSMQVDRQEGRPMEVEAILGEPLRRARAGGVSVPILESLYHAARVVDAARVTKMTNGQAPMTNQ